MPVSGRKKPTDGMRYVRLGSSGLKVSQIILGCICFGSPEWREWALPLEKSIEVIKAAYDAGVNAFETSYSYSRGQSEVVLGEALRRLEIPRDSVVIMTRIGGGRGSGSGDRTQGSLSRKNIMNGVKASLQRLQMDYIDVLHCAYFDEETPIAETMRALHDLVRAGHVRYIGMGPCWAYQFHIMQNYAITHNLTPFISVQSYYSLVYREDERELFPTMKHFGVGVVAVAPLAGKVLTRPYAEAQMDPAPSYHGGNLIRVVGRLERAAQSQKASMAQVAVSWVLDKKAITATVISAPDVNVLSDYIGASKVKLENSSKKMLEARYQPCPPIDHLSFGKACDAQ